MMFWLLLISVCLVYGEHTKIGETTESTGTVETMSIPKPQGCTMYNCKGGDKGSIIYGAGMINDVCICKLTSWESISKTAELIEELSRKVASFSARLEDVEERCLVGITVRSKLAK